MIMINSDVSPPVNIDTLNGFETESPFWIIIGTSGYSEAWVGFID